MQALKGEERKVDKLRALGLRKQYGSNQLLWFVCLVLWIHPSLEAKKVINVEMAMVVNS